MVGECTILNERYLMRSRELKSGCGRERVWFGGLAGAFIVQRYSTVHMKDYWVVYYT